MKGFNYAFVQKAEQPKKHELYIYDDITSAPHINWTTWSIEDSETSAEHFKKVLAEIPAEDEITVYINSAGGEAYEAIAIANQLRRHGHTTGIVDGMCHSAAFNILQGCDKRIMNPGTSAIIHNMWTIVQGNANDLRAAADSLDASMASCRQLYLERANITEEKLIELLDAETNLTPEQALEYGFIDEIGRTTEPAEQTASAEEERIASNENANRINSQLMEMVLGSTEPTKMKQGDAVKRDGFNRLFS